jgi:hypothetical protein
MRHDARSDHEKETARLLRPRFRARQPQHQPQRQSKSCYDTSPPLSVGGSGDRFVRLVLGQTSRFGRAIYVKSIDPTKTCKSCWSWSGPIQMVDAVSMHLILATYHGRYRYGGGSTV